MFLNFSDQSKWICLESMKILSKVVNFCEKNTIKTKMLSQKDSFLCLKIWLLTQRFLFCVMTASPEALHFENWGCIPPSSPLVVNTPTPLSTSTIIAIKSSSCMCQLPKSDTQFQEATHQSTWGHPQKLVKQHQRLHSRKYFYYSQRVVEPWNKLPEGTTKVSTLLSFKKDLFKLGL